MSTKGELRLQLRLIKDLRPTESISCSQKTQRLIARVEAEIGGKHSLNQGQARTFERDTINA